MSSTNVYQGGSYTDNFTQSQTVRNDDAPQQQQQQSGQLSNNNDKTNRSWIAQYYHSRSMWYDFLTLFGVVLILLIVFLVLKYKVFRGNPVVPAIAPSSTHTVIQPVLVPMHMGTASETKTADVVAEPTLQNACADECNNDDYDDGEEDDDGADDSSTTSLLLQRPTKHNRGKHSPNQHHYKGGRRPKHGGRNNSSSSSSSSSSSRYSICEIPSP